ILTRSVPICAEGGGFFSFEGSNEGWVIPDWAYYQGDHKAESADISSEKASKGDNSLEVVCNFPGDIWTAALIEHREDMDLSGSETISADIYLPKKAPKRIIVARFILTVGIGWHFTEMRYAVPLVPGRWTKLKAKLESEEVEKSEWKGRKEKRLFHHISSVRKIAIRIEYDASPPYKVGRKYKGPIYIDNVVIK
ncbi:MAG: hypothetical protein ACE5JK_07965, partial [Candidatus Omnitrophota bacterium]